MRECTRNVLRKMMTTTVAAQMCYAGRSSAKTGFATLKLGHVLQGQLYHVIFHIRFCLLLYGFEVLFDYKIH